MNANDNKQKAAGGAALPCTSIDGFYTPSAKRTIRRVLDGWLAKQQLTATEFIHSAAALQKFEGAGTVYQHAVQRMAVTQASRTRVPVVQIIRTLTDLTTAAMNRVYADERKGKFPAIEGSQIADKAAELETDPAGAYILNAILAKHLSTARDWNTKLLRILALHDEAQSRALSQGGTLLLRTTEGLVVEIIGEPDILSGLLGTEGDFSQRLFAAIRILKGHADSAEGIADSLQRLGRHFGEGVLREARLILAQYIQSECAGPKRLRPASLEDDLQAFGALVEELKTVPSPYLHGEDLTEALATRCKRFVTPEALAQWTAGIKAPDEKLDRVLALEAAVVGTANKRALTSLALALVTSHNFESDMSEEFQGLPRLRRLADLQARIQRSAFPEGPRETMTAALDAIAARFETQGRYLAGVEARVSDPVERVEFYLKLFAAGVFTQGTLARKARRALLVALAMPGFAESYARGNDKSRQAALMELVAQLESIGIPPEEALRAMSPG